MSVHDFLSFCALLCAGVIGSVVQPYLSATISQINNRFIK